MKPGTRILLVEDDRSIAGFVEPELERLGLDVRHAYDGPSGLEEVRRFGPGLILLPAACASPRGRWFPTGTSPYNSTSRGISLGRSMSSTLKSGALIKNSLKSIFFSPPSRSLIRRNSSKGTTTTTPSTPCRVTTCGPSRSARRTSSLNLCFASRNCQVFTLASILLSSLSILHVAVVGVVARSQRTNWPPARADP